jgi:hypothetical protein
MDLKGPSRTELSAYKRKSQAFSAGAAGGTRYAKAPHPTHADSAASGLRRTRAGAHGLYGQPRAEAVAGVGAARAQRAVGGNGRQRPGQLVQVHLPRRPRGRAGRAGRRGAQMGRALAQPRARARRAWRTAGTAQCGPLPSLGPETRPRLACWQPAASAGSYSHACKNVSVQATHGGRTTGRSACFPGSQARLACTGTCTNGQRRGHTGRGSVQRTSMNVPLEKAPAAK